ncbi:MAG: trypsin-like peptidase domain-containing protein [Rhodospirillales bacterium]|nr:trypsin-like peptidase domain-containing protein [Rhodospirillales bacterium]
MQPSETRPDGGRGPDGEGGRVAGPVPWYRHPAWFWLALGLVALLVVLLVYWLFLQPRAAVAPVVVAPPAASPPPGDGIPGAERQRRLAQQQDLNRALEERIARLRQQLAGNVCVAEGSSDTPAGGLAGSAPPVATPPGETAPRRTSQALVQQLENATVFVVTERGVASGFFISPQLIVTNRHVAETAKDGVMIVTSKALGRAFLADIVAMTSSSDKGGPDFAVARIRGGTARGALSITMRGEKLDPVVAAGYPGRVIAMDRALHELVSGSEIAAPELILSRGEISAVQTSPSGIPVVAHTANIMGGNSGGPLVDACGRVVGVNTLTTFDPEGGGKAAFALASAPLKAFLDRQRVPVSVDARSCAGS